MLLVRSELARQATDKLYPTVGGAEPAEGVASQQWTMLAIEKLRTHPPVPWRIAALRGELDGWQNAVRTLLLLGA